MNAETVLDVLDLLERIGVAAWVDGGWGVDALVGRQTRAHDDLDLVVALDAVERVQGRLAARGFVPAEAHLPIRFVLTHPDLGRIDFHTVTFDPEGAGLQPQPDGRTFRYPPEGFVSGTIGGRTVPCISARVQMLCHQGYEPKEKDVHDVHALHRAFGIEVPERYRRLVPRNPWLDIPEADYVAHMSSPTVGQRPVLARLLRDALETVRPRTVLVLGGSTGNGLEHVDPDVTARVTVVDVNPAYLRRLVERFPNPGFELDVRCADLADAVFERQAYDLVHAGLVLEYVEWSCLLPRLATTLRPRGILSVVLQHPSASTPAVTPTRFVSLRSLESSFRFVDPHTLVEAARHAGMALESRHDESLPAGKAFDVLRFVKAGEP